MRAELLTALACPDCGGRLDPEGDAVLRCRGCGSEFDVVDGAPHLLPSERPGEEWEQKQELGRIEYERGEGDAPHDVALRFGRFAGLRGLVLDVGCGIAPRPPYLEPSRDVMYVGLDPLDGAQRRDFDFVQGLGERLPFHDESFDGVISATMLDHVPEPGLVLAEARRVLKPNGRLAVWVGVVDERGLEAEVLAPLALPERPPVMELLRRYGVLGIASRIGHHLLVNRARALRSRLHLRFRRSRLLERVYADRARYHFRFFEMNDVLDLVRETGFRVLATERVDGGASGASLFVLAEPLA